jgi:uncharacterized Ntn-hydrolase superfamily protein
MYFLFFLLLATLAFSQKTVFKNQLVTTYSIVAKDPKTGNLGVAVQSNWFAVGSLVSWAEAGVGAIATQSFINTSFGPEGLKLMKQGKSAKEALDILISKDEGRDFRQLAIIDINGNTAVYTGKKCIEAAGDHNEKNFSVQANMMKKASVWPVMAKKYKEAEGEFADRLMQTLEAAQNQGGDIRGKQSAAILIVKAKATGKPWEDTVLKLQVDDHTTPLLELRRLYNVHLAYNHMNKGDYYVEKNDIDNALTEYSSAQKMFPNNVEMKYWTAIALANAKRLDEAIKIFKSIFTENSNWKILTKRIRDNGLLVVSDQDMKQIMTL